MLAVDHSALTLLMQANLQDAALGDTRTIVKRMDWLEPRPWANTETTHCISNRHAGERYGHQDVNLSYTQSSMTFVQPCLL